tara:strand:+ start:1429 stop:1659 length:231 start_codon:yes stop_codon:yes gene_type:complete
MKDLKGKIIAILLVIIIICIHSNLTKIEKIKELNSEASETELKVSYMKYDMDRQFDKYLLLIEDYNECCKKDTVKY